MAEALLRLRLTERGVGATIRSAGLMEPGRTVAPEVAGMLTTRGVDVANRPSRQLDPDEIANADLIIAMERRHLREAVLLVPQVFERAFTLKEIVRRSASSGGRREDEGFAEWLVRVGDGRERRQLLGDSPIDDIPDPYGGPKSGYVAAEAQISGLIDEFVGLAWPLETGGRACGT